MSSARRRTSALAALALLGLLFPVSASPVAAESGADVPSGFTDKVVWSLADPTVIAFSPNGTVFVGLKSGKILAFDSLSDTSATTVADLSNDVHNYWDRGLLGLVVDPQYPTRPYIYALYTYDHQPGNGNDVPRWGGGVNDACANPPGGNSNGCVVSGRLDRLTLNGSDVMTSRSSLITDWCQQFPSHSVGSLAFGPEGALYVSGGDGASFNEVDVGQLGQGYWGSNPCSDPNDEGGALRSQDLRTSGDVTSLDGAILRVDPDTGDAWPANANAGSSDENKARIIATGLRNPFRMTVRSNGDVFVGDVGWNTWEEIDKIANPDGTPPNFGWPCYEGASTQPDYQSFDTGICNGLSSQTGPAFTYNHDDSIVGGDGCSTGSSSISGIAFRGTAGNYPAHYDNGLFFADYSRHCIWFAPNAGGNPDFGNVEVFANLFRSSETDGGAVDVKVAPSGVVVYADLNRDEVRQVTFDTNGPPTAAFTASPSSGTAPLTVHFNAGGSTDPDGDTLSYSWDLDGNGTFGDSTSKTPTKTYTSNGSVSVGLRVTAGGDTDEVHHTISVGSNKPVATIDDPTSSLTWAVGDGIDFSGHATDAQDGDLPASAFEWTLKIEHCPSNCHEHVLQVFDGVSSGSFDAPNHDYPSYLRLVLKVTDSDGMTDTRTVDLHPKTGTMDAASDPVGIPLTVAHSLGIVGSQIDVSAPSSIVLGEETWAFDHWSDGGARAHGAVVEDSATHLLASYHWASSADATGSCGSAPVGATASYWRAGRLATGTDVDWYRFSVSSTRSVRIVLGDLPADASLKLYKGCSTLLATSDRAGAGSEEIIKSLSAGTYAVRVQAKGTSSDSPYALLIKRLSSGLSMLSAAKIVDGGAGTLTLVGEVWNENSTFRGPITVTAKLYDDDGHLLATRSAEAVLYAKSHSRSPFRITGSLPDGFSRVSWSISAPVSSKTYRGVTMTGTVLAEVGGHWRGSGHVKATSGSVKTIKVAMTLYDDRLSVVDVVKASLHTTHLTSNQTTTFLGQSTLSDLDINKASFRALGFKP